MDSQQETKPANLDEMIEASDTGRKRKEISKEFVDIIQSVVEKIQEEKGSPPCAPEFFQHIKDNKLFGEGAMYMGPLYKAPAYSSNRFYTTPCLNYWSMEKWNDEYETYQERFENRWGKPYGYVLDNLLRVRPGPSTMTVDYGQLIDILCSSDPTLLEQNAAIFEDIKYPKFLKRKNDTVTGKTIETEGNVISYCTYPRVGNTFLRKYLQNITGIVTGSDMPLELDFDLKLGQFPGQEITDDSVWVTKSHYPMIPPMGVAITKSNKMVVCVRCPYDITVSKMNFLPIHNHGGQINQDFQKDIPEIWDAMVKNTAVDIKNWHDRVFSEMIGEVPVFFLRYEDLVLDPASTLEQLFCFMLGLESIKGLNIERRIQEVLKMGHAATIAYEQKAITSNIKFNKNIDKFNAEQQKFMADTLQEYMQIFGYCSEKGEKAEYPMTAEQVQDQQTSLQFAKYEQIDPELHNKYKRSNQEQMTRCIQLHKDGKLKEHVFVANADPSKQLEKKHINFEGITMKEKPQIRKVQ